MVLKQMAGERPYVSFYASVVADFVEVVCCYSRFDLAGYGVENFARETANFSHGILACLVEDSDLVAPQHFIFRIAIFRPRRLDDVLGYRPPWGKRVDRPQRSCEVE